jgi:hypothetical protein
MMTLTFIKFVLRAEAPQQSCPEMSAVKSTIAAALVFLHMAAPLAEAQLLRRRSAHARSGAIALRRRLHINPLITEPGTVELEWNNAWSFTDTYTVPSTLKWTPQGSHILWGRTEFSGNFDMVSSTAVDGRRITHSSDHAALAATILLSDGEHWNLAVAPQAVFGFRDSQGTRAGATLITRYDFSRSSAGATLTWTGAAGATDSNPAGTWDAGAGFGQSIGAGFTLHCDTQYERSTGFAGAWSFFEGIEYQVNDNVAFDLSAQHVNLTGGVADHQLLAGLTINLGRPGRWFRTHR